MHEQNPSFDLHGYSTDTAIWITHIWTREAWEHGCLSITFLHGAASVAEPPSNGRNGGRGAVKWALRQAVRAGEFAPYAVRKNKKHQLLPGKLTLFLQTCPDPHPEGGWTAAPPPDYPDSEKQRFPQLF